MTSSAKETFDESQGVLFLMVVFWWNEFYVGNLHISETQRGVR